MHLSAVGFFGYPRINWVDLGLVCWLCALFLSILYRFGFSVHLKAELDLYEHLKTNCFMVGAQSYLRVRRRRRVDGGLFETIDKNDNL